MGFSIYATPGTGEFMSRAGVPVNILDKATTANEEIGKYLNIKPGDPVLKLERKMETNRKDYFFYSSIFCNTNDFYLEGSF